MRPGPQGASPPVRPLLATMSRTWDTARQLDQELGVPVQVVDTPRVGAGEPRHRLHALPVGYALDFSAAPAETALLGPIAWSAVDLLRSGRFERVKRCPGPGCGWLFFDHSKNNSRRWCDMATCGNRTKGRRHRARRV